MRRWRIHWKQSEKSLTPDLRSKGDAFKESRWYAPFQINSFIFLTVYLKGSIPI